MVSTSTQSLPPLVSGHLPLIGHLLEFATTAERVIWRGYHEHGNVFRIRVGRREVIALLGRDYSNLFFKNKTQALSTRAAYPFFATMFAPDFYSLGDDYNAQKRLIMPSFQGKHLEDYLRIMNEEAELLVEKLGAAGEFDPTVEFGPVVMRVAQRAFLGETAPAEMADFDYYGESRAFSAGMSFKPRWMPESRRSRVAAARLKAELAAMIARRRANPPAVPDFLTGLASATYADGAPVPDDVIVNLTLLLLWAGHETSTGQLASAIIELVRHTDDLDRVRTECDEVLSGGPVDLAAMRRLTVADAVLRESGRLHPVAPVLLRNAVADIDLDNGMRIPEGSWVLVAPTVTHRLRDEYPDPDRFRPDRFLDADAEQARGAMIDFGGGVHRCLGERFARLEMQVLMAHLVRSFDMEAIGDPTWTATTSGSRWPTGCRIAYRARTVRT